jgi:hypothetical protein
VHRSYNPADEVVPDATEEMSMSSAKVKFKQAILRD